MKKSDCSQVLYLTQHILEEYWQKNLVPLKEHLHKNILWIGSMDEEYMFGKETMLKRLNENNNAMPPVFLDQQGYGIVQNEGNTCVIAGRYRAFTKPESGILLSEKQRVTFVWEKVKIEDQEEMQIKHLHLSNVLHIQSEDERFPTKAGKENYEYLKRIMAERSRDEVISLRDRHGVNRVLNYSDIMYLQADGNYVHIILANGQENLRVRGPLAVLMEKMPEGFIKVRRSLVVNRSYVKSVHGRDLVMMDDEKFRIPASSCAQVQCAINRTEPSK